MAYFIALETLLVITTSQGLSRLIVESDSKLVISKVNKLINETSLEKKDPRWRLEKHISQVLTISFI